MSDPEFWELRMLIEQWDLIADQVQGYLFPLEDYLNDMDLRRMIDERMRAASTSGGMMPPSALLTLLESADERFRRATTETSQNIWGEENARDEGWSAAREWYYYRVPKSRPDWL